MKLISFLMVVITVIYLLFYFMTCRNLFSIRLYVPSIDMTAYTCTLFISAGSDLSYSGISIVIDVPFSQQRYFLYISYLQLSISSSIALYTNNLNKLTQIDMYMCTLKPFVCLETYLNQFCQCLPFKFFSLYNLYKC